MIREIEAPDAWAAKALPDLHGSSDRSFFLDSPKRMHRLRPGVVAVHRDGRKFFLEMPLGQVTDIRDACLAAELFAIGERYEKAAIRVKSPDRRSIFNFFSRRANANRNACTGRGSSTDEPS